MDMKTLKKIVKEVEGDKSIKDITMTGSIQKPVIFQIQKVAYDQDRDLRINGIDVDREDNSLELIIYNKCKYVAFIFMFVVPTVLGCGALIYFTKHWIYLVLLPVIWAIYKMFILYSLSIQAERKDFKKKLRCLALKSWKDLPKGDILHFYINREEIYYTNREKIFRRLQ